MLAYQLPPETSSRLTTADIFETARLLQQQLCELEDRFRISAESEALRILHRADLQRALAEFTAIETAEARATADLAATLARLRSANRTSITQSQSQSQCQLPFPFARKLQLGIHTRTPPTSPSSRGSPATAPPGAGAGVPAQARWSKSSPFARLARDALFECSSPRGPLPPARADADPRTGDAQPTGGLPPTPMSDAEAALARTLHEFFAADLPQPQDADGDVSLSSQYSYAAGPADVSFGETGTPTRGAGARLSLLDPRLRAVALGAHVVTAARASSGTDEDAPASPALGSGSDTSDADARDSVRVSAVAGLSAALAGRLAKATFVRVCARGAPAAGRADRLGEHEIAPAAEEMRVDEDMAQGEGAGAGRGRWSRSRPSLLQRMSGAHKMKARLSRGGGGGGGDTSATRSPRRARPAGVYGKCGIIGGQVKLVLVVGRRRMSLMAEKVHGVRRQSRQDGDLVAAARDAMREGSFSIESVVAVAESE